LIAEIIVNSNARALNRIFDYIVPKEMEKDIFVGARIYAPFGKSGKLEDGFVIGLKENSEFANKELAKIIYEMSIPEDKMELAKLMARKYFCNISDCIKLMLPPGTSSKEARNWEKEKVGNFVYLSKEAEEIEEDIASGVIKSAKHKKALEFLIDNDGMYLPDLEKILELTKSVFNTLEKNGYIEIVEKQIERNPFINKNVQRDKPKKLTEEQQRAYDSISYCIENDEPTRSLIYGITGSRKN
jgi:primosomal protein N' (replication factor Y)